MLPVTNKEFHKNSEEWQNLLNEKAAEYVNGDMTCNGKQLYNMFKTQRRCYTNYNNLLNKSGSEAAPVLENNHTVHYRNISSPYIPDTLLPPVLCLSHGHVIH